MANVVYHWKHGWIPLDHTAALSKAKGNHEKAAAMLRDAHSSHGIQTRQDLAKAIMDAPNVSSEHRPEATREIQKAAAVLNAGDLLPNGKPRAAPEPKAHPITNGSEKQNKWATEIRDQHLKSIDSIIASRQPSERIIRGAAAGKPNAITQHENAVSAVDALHQLKHVVASVDDANLLIDLRAHSPLLLATRHPGGRALLGDKHFARLTGATTGVPVI